MSNDALTPLHATGIQNAAWLLLAFPLFGAAVLLLGGKRTNPWGHVLGVAMPVLAFAYGVAAYVQMLGYPAAERVRELTIFQWIDVARFQVPLGLRLDQLSICFVLLITGVGSLIHIFAVGYMANDPERRRFFGYMNLFLAAMLLLVLASNYLVLYAGWEGVGLASYLLIGFWQYKPTAATAAKKAFIVNRVGDVGLSVAIMLMSPAVRHRDFHRRGRRGGLGEPRRRDRARPPPAARRLRQVGSGTAPVLAAGRNGGPDASVGAHPRGHDGDRRRLPHRQVRADLQPDRGCQARRRDRRRGHPAVGRHHRLCQGRHQEGTGRIHDALFSGIGYMMLAASSRPGLACVSSRSRT